MKYSILILILLVVLVLFASCGTIIGYTVGSVVDSEFATSTGISDTHKLSEGDLLVLYWKDGSKNYGRVTTILPPDSIRIAYFPARLRIDTSINELIQSGNLDRFELMKQSKVGRRTFTTLGAVTDLTLMYLIISLNQFSGTWEP